MNLYALVMVKNESAVIERTLDSVGKLIKGGCQIGGIYVYDTGSVDGTLDICKKWGCENEVDIRTARGPWENFAVGRNTALEWTEKSVPSNSWILLLDANDELRCEPESLNRLNRVGLNVDGCYINQVWKLQPGMGTTKYKGLKLIRTGRNWFWKYPVHELLKKKNCEPRCTLLPNISLFQDRNLDNQKTLERAGWDYAVLRAEHKANPRDTRIMFYLANTLAKLKEWDSALRMYKMRVATRDADVDEISMEAYESLMRCGHITIMKNKPYEAISWYMRAVAFSREIGHFRIDGLVESGKIYRKLKQYELSFMLLNYAKDHEIDEDAPGFINTGLLKHSLWRELTYVAWHLGKYDEGEKACLRALESSEANVKKEIDRANLEWFTLPMVLKNSYYINLDDRPERNRLTRIELRKIMVMNPQRVAGTKMSPGIIGCLASHIETLETGIKNEDEFIAIFEDDVVFKSPAILLSGIRSLQFDEGWDVLLLGGMNDGGHKPYRNFPAVQTTRCMSCVAYIVKKRYAQKLLNCWKDLWHRLHSSDLYTDGEVSLDVAWWELQREDTFVLITPLTVTQRVGFSDNANMTVSYDTMMLNLERNENPPHQDFKLRVQSEDDLVVSESLLPGAGMGLFARVAINKNTILCDYTGVVRSNAFINKLHNNCIDVNTDYLLKLDGNLFVDALPCPEVKARYINDGLDVEKCNCMYVMDPLNRRALVVSTRLIFPGEELYVSYGSSYWKNRKKSSLQPM